MAKSLQSLSCTLLLFLPWAFLHVSAQNELSFPDPITLSSSHYSEIILRPYDWRYIRVDLPPGFVTMYLNIKSNVHIDAGSAKRIPKSKLPMICFRNGSPPLPDVSNTYLTVLSPPTNNSVGDIQAHHLVEQCYPLQENIMLALTNEQISSGVWYIGLFNGYGSSSTQSKMIIRGSDFSFSANISVEGCPISPMWGYYCNQTVIPLSCVHSDVDMNNQTSEKITTCRNSFEASCIASKAVRAYSLDVSKMVEQLQVMAVNVSLNGRPIDITGNVNGTLFARYGAIPSRDLHDYSNDISKGPLIIQSPKIGRWFISLLPDKQAKRRVTTNEEDIISGICYSLDWQVQECTVGKAGPNCTWESYMLQTVIRKNPSVPFESYYWPIGEEISPTSSKFLLEPRLSNSSLVDKSEYAWTYFLVDLPRGAAGGNIHIQLNSDSTLDYEIYSRFGGLPSLDTWDYYYLNTTSSSNGSIFFKLYDSDKTTVSFYILYAKEGIWSFGLRYPVRAGGSNVHQTFMSITIERCPRGCSSHGHCQNVLDASGLTLYSYCYCDRDHGGFDCSIELESHLALVVQSFALIASNGAAILPAIWTLRQKAFAEWVLFTTSGIASGLYHACDRGTWCILPFRVLQFMDFWLSFMAVISTFVYISITDEVTKRVFSTAVAILTALLAVNGATRASNIIIVIAIGTLGLIIGWAVESSTAIRSLSFSAVSSLNIHESWQNIKDSFYNFFKTLRNQFRWFYVLAGFVALILAGLSWTFETDETYWIWHSVWHIAIYTSSFFFLCSKVFTVEVPEPQDVTYELTRQDSSSRL